MVVVVVVAVVVVVLVVVVVFVGVLGKLVVVGVILEAQRVAQGQELDNPVRHCSLSCHCA